MLDFVIISVHLQQTSFKLEKLGFGPIFPEYSGLYFIHIQVSDINQYKYKTVRFCSAY